MKKQTEYFSSYTFAFKFYAMLQRELEFHEKSEIYLKRSEYKIFRKYYSPLTQNSLNYFSHYYARLLMHPHLLLNQRPAPFRVLDAGCGLGSETIFFALMGADVLGVDVNPERLDIARKRINYYKNSFGINSTIKFVNKNICGLNEADKFDLVWSNQSISHIDPIEDFLLNAWKNLKSKGYLIISDSNSFNPMVALMAALVHFKEGKYTKVIDPDTGQLIPYAKERMVSPIQLKTLLSDFHGAFKPISTVYQGFAPRMFSKYGFYRDIEAILPKVPLLKHIGATYLLVVQKA